MNLVWKQNGNPIKNGTVNNPLIFPVGFPSTVTDTETITLSSSTQIDGTYGSLTNVQLYLQGDADQVNTLLNIWPNYSALRSPARPDVNGGLEISCDNGYSFQRLGAVPETGQRLGFPDEPDTWITLPGSCIVPGAVSGILGSQDIATISIRYRIPALANQFDVFDVRLEASFDVG